MSAIENIKPERVFYFFKEISNIPRGSKNEKQVGDFIIDFASKKGLYCERDEANNVFIRKEGSKGYENSPTVILQGHLDMVCEKNKDTEHDFVTEGIKLTIDGDFIKACGTTLGADNGIAIAYMLAILDSDDIQCPPIEAVFTTEEEIGLNGAAKFDTSKLEGRILLNMDTEEEGVFVVSCCGGMRATIHIEAEREETDSDLKPYIIKVKGLKGGHSGSDIHLQRANANKILGRILYNLNKSFCFKIANVDGGLMDNAIARESEAIVLVHENDMRQISERINSLKNIIKSEYNVADEGIQILFENINEVVDKSFSDDVKNKIISALMLIPNGVITQSLEIEGLVESSNNLGVVKTTENEILFSSAVRSNVESRKDLIYYQIDVIANILGGKASFTGVYPGWRFNPESRILELVKSTYEEIYKKPAEITAIHAGLECGLFKDKIEGLDVISFGPNIYGAHTPDEKMSISSVYRVWNFIIELLSRIK